MFLPCKVCFPWYLNKKKKKRFVWFKYFAHSFSGQNQLFCVGCWGGQIALLLGFCLSVFPRAIGVSIQNYSVMIQTRKNYLCLLSVFKIRCKWHCCWHPFSWKEFKCCLDHILGLKALWMSGGLFRQSSCLMGQ